MGSGCKAWEAVTPLTFNSLSVSPTPAQKLDVLNSAQAQPRVVGASLAALGAIPAQSYPLLPPEHRESLIQLNLTSNVTF